MFAPPNASDDAAVAAFAELVAAPDKESGGWPEVGWELVLVVPLAATCGYTG